jgi:hypothetical protein
LGFEGAWKNIKRAEKGAGESIHKCKVVQHHFPENTNNVLFSLSNHHYTNLTKANLGFSLSPGAALFAWAETLCLTGRPDLAERAEAGWLPKLWCLRAVRFKAEPMFAALRRLHVAVKNGGIALVVSTQRPLQAILKSSVKNRSIEGVSMKNE